MRPGLYIVPLIYFLGNFYLYQSACRHTQPSTKIRKAILLGVIVLLSMFPVSKVWTRHNINSINHLLTLLSSIWMGMTFFLFLLASAAQFSFYLYRKIRSASGFSWSKSLAYRRLFVFGVAAGAVMLSGFSMSEARHIKITDLSIPLHHLPPELNGLSIVQISDVHYGVLEENGRLADIVHRVNSLHPDVVVITGDLVDESVSHMEDMAAPLADLKSRLGVIGIMGNHDFYAGADRVEKIMRQAGIQVLRNQIKVLPGGLQVLGIDDPTFNERKGLPLPDFDGLVKKLDPERPSILLYHKPLHFEEVSALGIGLQLSGHIHGPQFYPLVPFLRIFYSHLRGLYHTKDSYLYVSRGVGTGGTPMRLGSPPEIVRIRLFAPNRQKTMECRR